MKIDKTNISTSNSAVIASTKPGQIEIGDECVLRSRDQAAAMVRCRHVDLEGREISAHIETGKMVTQLALEWNGSVSFVLNQDVELKKLHFSDTLVEQTEMEGVNDPAAEFDARFNLMVLELSRFLPALWKALGGLQTDL